MREVKNCLTCFYGIDDGKDFPKIILVGKPLFKLSPHIGFYDFVGCFGPWGSIKPNCPAHQPKAHQSVFAKEFTTL